LTYRITCRSGAAITVLFSLVVESSCGSGYRIMASYPAMVGRHLHQPTVRR